MMIALVFGFGVAVAQNGASAVAQHGASIVAQHAVPLPASISVRVDGEGYLRFVRDGRIVYATSANLAVQSGVLASKGLPLTPAVHIPEGATRLDVDLSGNVVALIPTGKSVCGRLVLARFESKPSMDQGYFVSMTRASLGNPGEGIFGVIRGTLTKEDGLSGGPSISVRAVSEVEGDNVTVGDIASCGGDSQTKEALQAIVVCTSPPIGIDLPITTSRMQGLVKRAGIEAQIQVPVGAVVRRKAQAIKQDDFIAAAVKAAHTKLGFDLLLTCADQQGDFKAPLGQSELRPEGVSTSGTNMTVTIGVYVEGKRINSRSVNLRPDASAEIKPGTIVKVVMKSAGVSVEIPGRTRTGGMVGQTVIVVTETGSVLTGVVISGDKVEVKL